MERFTRNDRQCRAVIDLNRNGGNWSIETRKDGTGYYISSDAIDRLAAYEDTGLTPEEIKKVQEAVTPIPFGHFHDIMEAEKDGRLLVLPCKPGDPFFTLEKFCDEHGRLDELTNHELSDCDFCDETCNAELRVVENKFFSATSILIYKECIGESVFLTREEAEAVLKGGAE